MLPPVSPSDGRTLNDFEANDEGELAHQSSYIEPADTLELRQAEAAAFAAWLVEIGGTKRSLSRIMIRLGDHRTRRTILRTLERYAAGTLKISGEMKVIMTISGTAADHGVPYRRRRALERNTPPICWTDALVERETVLHTPPPARKETAVVFSCWQSFRGAYGEGGLVLALRPMTD